MLDGRLFMAIFVASVSVFSSCIEERVQNCSIQRDCPLTYRSLGGNSHTNQEDDPHYDVKISDSLLFEGNYENKVYRSESSEANKLRRSRYNDCSCQAYYAICGRYDSRFADDPDYQREISISYSQEIKECMAEFYPPTSPKTALSTTPPTNSCQTVNIDEVEINACFTDNSVNLSWNGTQDFTNLIVYVNSKGNHLNYELIRHVAKKEDQSLRIVRSSLKSYEDDELELKMYVEPSGHSSCIHSVLE